MTVDEALRYAYKQETNISITTFWDDGWQVKIGDDWNGFSHEKKFKRDGFDLIGPWIVKSVDERIKSGKFSD